METSGLAVSAVDQRASKRLPAFGTLEYQASPDDTGWARWQTVSRDGACIHLGRYLRPGKYSLLRWRRHLGTAEFKARVVWCRPVSADGHFLAGLKIIHDEPGSEEALAAVAGLSAAARL
jgi:hypothetical protein